MRISSIVLISGLAFLGAFAGSAFAQPVISIEGSCPGAVRFRWEGAAPNEWAGLLYSDERGTITLSQPCGGTVIGLGPRGLRLVSVFRTSANGAGVANGQADSRSCGGFLQLVVQDGYPCTTSNVVQVPE